MSLGERVQTLMAEQGLSQAELARRVGLSQPAIFALIHKNKTGSKSLHRIARELGTTPAFLNGETDVRDADFVVETEFSADERDLIEVLRRIDPRDRTALMRIAHSLAAKAVEPPALAVHSPQRQFRGQGQ